MDKSVVVPLSAAQSRVLRVITEGGKMESRHPHARRYLLFNKTGKEYAAKVPEGTVASLLELQLIRTTLGVRAVQKCSALPPEDHSQLELIDEAPAIRQGAA